MSRYTDGTYLAHNPTWHTEDSPWKAEQILKMLRRQGLQPGTVCEVGCGAGRVLATLAAGLPNAIALSGYEISPDAYQLASQRQDDRLHFYLQDLLEIDELAFDLALAIDVIEHVEDVFGFLRQLRPKADYKIFHIPLDMTVLGVLRPNILLNLRKQVGHIHSFTKDTALALLQETGYTILDWFYTPWAFELKSTTPRIAMLNPLRRILFPVKPDMAVRVLGGYSILVLTK